MAAGPGQLGLVVGDHRLVGARIAQPPRAAPLALEIEVEPGLLRELSLRQERALAGEHALDRQQREATVLGGAAQLLEFEALGLQRVKQIEPGAPRPIALRSLQQAFRLEVDRHGHIVTAASPAAPSAHPRTLLT
jgi:hypothetical protein